MMNGAVSWFTRSTPRRQLWLVCVGAGLLLVLVLALLLPLHAARAELRTAHAQQLATLSEVRELAAAHARLANNQAQSAGSGLPLIARVNQSLERQRFQPQRIQQGQQGELQLRVEDVEFDTLLAWLYELEQTPGVLLDLVSLSRSGSGRVSANLTLRSL